MHELALIGMAVGVGLLIVGLAVYRLAQFFVGFYEGLRGIEPPTERGFEVLPIPDAAEMPESQPAQPSDLPDPSIDSITRRP